MTTYSLSRLTGRKGSQMRKHSKNSPVVVKRVPGVHLTEEDIKDIQEAARRLLNKMESINGGNLHENIR